MTSLQLTAAPMSFKPRLEGLFPLSRDERDGVDMNLNSSNCYSRVRCQLQRPGDREPPGHHLGWLAREGFRTANWANGPL
jgi:hypothetical protein